MGDLDRIDRNILKILQQDGRISNVALSRRVNLSPTPCLERVRRLEKAGYITGYMARLSPEKLGADFVTFMTVQLNRTSNDAFERFADEIRRIEEVEECHMVGGGFDYILKIRTRSMEAFRALMGHAVFSMAEVYQTHSYFVMEQVKDSPAIKVPQ